MILIAAALALTSTIGAFIPHQTMMSTMMGGNYSGFFLPIVLTTFAIIAMVATAYVMAFPSIKYSAPYEKLEEDSSAVIDPIEIVIRISKPDERNVLKFLRESGGTCYQKDITYKTKLSKIKAHRIIARLAERGIVQVRKVGKTNEISIPPWLKAKSGAKPAQAQTA